MSLVKYTHDFIFGKKRFQCDKSGVSMNFAVSTVKGLCTYAKHNCCFCVRCSYSSSVQFICSACVWFIYSWYWRTCSCSRVRKIIIIACLPLYVCVSEGGVRWRWWWWWLCFFCFCVFVFFLPTLTPDTIIMACYFRSRSLEGKRKSKI